MSNACVAKEEDFIKAFNSNTSNHSKYYGEKASFYEEMLNDFSIRPINPIETEPDFHNPIIEDIFNASEQTIEPETSDIKFNIWHSTPVFDSKNEEYSYGDPSIPETKSVYEKFADKYYREKVFSKSRFQVNNNYNNLIMNKEKSKTITTVNIEGVVYPISKCVNVDGYWYPCTDKSIAKDIVTGTCFRVKNGYEIHDSVMINNKGKMIGVDPVMVSKFSFNMCPFIQSRKYAWEGRVINLDNIKGWEFKEDPTKGIIIDHYADDIPINQIKFYEVYKNQAILNPLLKGRIGDVSQTYLITEGIKYTFGVEMEVNRGNVPSWIAGHRYNMSCIRDGSINGGEGGAEFVTGVLIGDNGINHLQQICQELSRRTTVDKSCGVHLHLGGINFSRTFLVNCYKLALILENEIASTLPRSRRENPYCRKLKKFNFKSTSGSSIEEKILLEEDYNALFKYISYEKANNPNFDYNKTSQHPLGHKCGYNHDTPRYCWLNFVPAFYDTRGNKSYSIEIRSMQGSTNFLKIRNWLLFFMGFMSFVERYPNDIVNGLKMKDIIDRCLPKKSKSLNMYFDSKKKLFEIASSESAEYDVNAESNTSEFKNIKELILE